MAQIDVPLYRERFARWSAGAFLDAPLLQNVEWEPGRDLCVLRRPGYEKLLSSRLENPCPGYRVESTPVLGGLIANIAWKRRLLD